MISSLLLVSTLVQSPAPALREYSVDAGHSPVEFSVKFALTHVRGRFTQWRGTILFDSTNPGNSSITAVFDAKSLDTGWPHRDEHLRTSDFFDVAQFPSITFQSERVTKEGDTWIAEGPLTMHGVTKQMRLPFQLLPSSPSRSPESGSVTLNLTGTMRLSRADFGVNGGATYNSWYTRARNATVSDSVDISFEIEAWRADEVSYHPPSIDVALRRIDSGTVAAQIARLKGLQTTVPAKDWPNYFRGQDFVVRALIAAHRNTEALTLAKALPDLFPNSSTPYLTLGYAAASAGDTRAAAAAYARARAVHVAPVVDPNEPFPQDDESWYYADQLARAELEAGRVNVGLGLAEVLAAIYPGIARAHARYGQALALTGKRAEADSAFARGLGIDAGETRSLEYRRRLRR